MSSVPKAPTPPDGNCTATSNNYTYTSTDGSSYIIDFCTGGSVSNLSAGSKMASPSGIWSCGNNFLDARDGNVYPTVQIGTQCWFAKNLAYLPMVHSNTQFTAQGASSQPGYGVLGYDGSDINTAKAYQISGVNIYNTYGVLYNWHAAMAGTTTQGTQGSCPSGWYVPTYDQFAILKNYLITNSQYRCGSDYYQIGKSLANTSGWLVNGIICTVGNDQASNNITGFTALSAGSRNNNGLFLVGTGYNTSFWSSSAASSEDAWAQRLDHDIATVYLNDFDQRAGFSVRCLKN